MDTVQIYVSTLDGKQQLAPQPLGKFIPSAGAPDENTLVVDPTVRHQPILGFGGTMVDSDVYCLMRMCPEKRDEVLKALFSKAEGAGWNFVRIPFGSTDWERDTSFYTYDDMPRGKKDWDLEYFTIQRDIDRGLPDILRRIKEINPEIIILASVWGVPGWMKENDSIMFGRFDPQYTEVYARYLRKAIQAWNALGIDIYAITTQNEPWTGEDRATPTCRFTWRLQMPVLKALKKEFDVFGIKTQIWCYDHNFDMAEEFVIPLLEDPETYNAVKGVAMHDYGGSPKVMGRLQAMFPEMPFYMTERQVGDPEGLEHLVQQFHNGSRSYLQWTTMTDEYGGPHQFHGHPFFYGRPVPIEQRNFVYNMLNAPDTWGKGSSWGLYAQFTKFICRGMERLDSSYGHRRWVTCAAFQQSDGDIAVVVVNVTDALQKFKLRIGSGESAFALPAKAIGTFVISPGGLCKAERLPVSAAPVKSFIEPPAFDLELADILLASPVKAGEEAVITARVRNVGNAPTPSGCPLYVNFSLDGDCPIARSVTVPPAIHPDCEVLVAANIPFGMKETWTAEAGYHFICAVVKLGNTFYENNMENNRKAKEFFFSK